ncbi:hypothetical protein V5799_032337 [Amblyomma americanum]|uniref:Uncharacterized protein n=1 Tax=Amblyomma americanum TaxID=6943 RepID=A0AAQ4DRG4_AMBAM
MDYSEPGPSNAEPGPSNAEPGLSNATPLDLRPQIALFPGVSDAEEFDSDESDEQFYDACSEYVDVGTPVMAEENDSDNDAENESLLGSSNTEAPSDLQQCLYANQVYQEFLENAVRELTEFLEKNRQLQEELPARVAERTQRRRKPKVRKNWYHSLVFHHPYFRDVNGMSAPPNEDELAKRANKELDPYLTPTRVWTTEECRSLVNAVQDNLLEQNLEALMDRKKTLSERLLTTDDPSQNAELKERISQLDEQMSKVREMTLVELLEQSTRPIDWLRIAANNMNSDRTAFGCEMHWRHLLDVRLNQGPWTPEEEERLCTLVTKWDERCWDQVAAELNTGRSAFQCAQHYCMNRAVRVNIGPFTPSEDERLRLLINLCSERDNISWSQVAHFMGTRSKKQVATLLPGRTKHQCRERYISNFACDTVSGPYTPSEDKALVELVDKHGLGCWAQVAKGMPWRTSHSVLTRYRRLSQMVGKDKVTAADLEKLYTTPDSVVAEVPRMLTTAMDRRINVYRRICRMINTSTQREVALKLVKCDSEIVDRETCLRLYRRLLHKFQSGRWSHHAPTQARSLNRAIAQYAQPLYRPLWRNMAAYEHEEWQAVTNVLHDVHNLERSPGDPKIEQMDTVPVFEEFFCMSVLGVPANFEPGTSHQLPLLAPCETTMATFGRLVDRFADGDAEKCWSFLRDFESFPELSAALDAVNVESIQCADCTSRALLEDELPSMANRELALYSDQLACRRCVLLRETRRNYDVLRSHFLSYFFWPLLLDEQNVAETVVLPPGTPSKGRKVRRVRRKQKKPWVKEAWAQRRRQAAQAAAAAESQGGQGDASGKEAVAEDNDGEDDEAMPSTSQDEGSDGNMAVDEGTGDETTPSTSQ